MFNHFKELTSEINSQEHNNIDITQFIQTEDTGSILDKFITAEEILKVIRNLKNNKAAGPDYILNEYIVATKELLLPLYVKLFNRVLDSGKIPVDWLIGWIVPIFKKKGNPTDPSNYRGMTVLSCLGKVFTSILNNRLTAFSNLYNILLENQAGYRKGYSTIDQIFLLKGLIDLFINKSKMLFCLFVD